MKNNIVCWWLLAAFGTAGPVSYIDGVMTAGNGQSSFIDASTRLFVVIDSFASPYSYSAGLGCDGRYVWNDHAFSPTGFARMDPLTHAVVNSFTPAYGNRDMAFDGTYLWASHWQTNSIYKYDTATCTVQASYDPPFAGHANGMAWDGAFLWVGEESGRIYKMNTLGDTIRSIPFLAAYPSDPRGLGFAAGHLWVGHQGYGRLYEIDTITGAIINYYTAPGVVTSQRFQQGVDFDGQYLWSTVGGAANVIYKIDIGLVNIKETDRASTGRSGLRVMPNPASGTSRVYFSLAHAAAVKLGVVDAGGRTVATLINVPCLAAAQYQLALPSLVNDGVYFVVLETGGRSEAVKIVTAR